MLIQKSIVFLGLIAACSNGFAAEFRIINTQEFPKMGMFAVANQILGQLSIFETNGSELAGLLVDLGAFGLYYDPAHGPNWWNYYFEPISLGDQRNSRPNYLSKAGYFDAFKIRKKLSRSRASELVKKYIQVRSSILEKVDQFAARYFQGFFTLGVHYRGTDKVKEAPKVPYESVVETIISSMPMDRPCRIFVATDEASFLEMMRTRFPDQIVAAEAHRSTGNEGIHFSKNNPYELGEESLVDSLLLSRCDLLIRTSSNLSLWSTYFNPELPTILLNVKYKIKEHVEPE